MSIYLIAVSVPISLHSHASSVPILNGTNFSDWSEQVQFHLSVLDLDLALRTEKLPTITEESSAEEKTFKSFLGKIEQIEHYVYANEYSEQH